MKKIISILLACALFSGSCVSAFAQGTAEVVRAEEITERMEKREDDRGLSVEERIEKRKAEAEKERLERRSKEDGREAELNSDDFGIDPSVSGEDGMEKYGVTYTFKDGTLTISGDGDIIGFVDAFAVKVKSVVIGEGVTTIPDDTFENFYNLKSVTFSDSVEFISNDAFSKCHNLKSINIPANVSYIAGDAFSDCYSLENITVAEDNADYKSIDGVLFGMIDGEQSLIQYPAGNKRTTYTIPEGTAGISYDAFKRCINLKEITVPDSVTEIYSGAFSYCTNLERITLSDSITTLEDDTFLYCMSLKEITIPDMVDYIGDDVFGYCYNLETAVLPASLDNFGNYVFDYCYSLESIQIAEGNEEFRTEDGILFGTVKATGENGETVSTNAIIKYPPAKEGAEYTIPDDVTSIYKYAFTDTEYLQKVVIHDGVTDIREHAFGYSSIKNVELPENMTLIPDGMFLGCYDLTEIVIPDSVSRIEDHAFSDCYSLENIKLPENLKSIGAYAFADCSGLTGIEIPAKGFGEVTEFYEIGERIFARCYMLEKVTLPDTFPMLTSGMFLDCLSLKEINIPASVTEIDTNVFSGCYSLEKINVDENNTAYKSIDGVLFQTVSDENEEELDLVKYPPNKEGSSYDIPSVVTSLSVGAFSDNVNLERVTVPDGITAIGTDVFSFCENLVSIELPQTVNSIGKGAFEWCEKLKEIRLPDAVEEIGAGAFEGCYSLEEMYIPEARINDDAFLYCSIKAFNISEENEIYTEIDGVLYDEDMTNLVAYPSGSENTTYTIPASVYFMNDSLSECYNLEEILVEEGNERFKAIDGILYDYDVTRIEKYPKGKTDEEFIIPDTVTDFGYTDYEFNMYVKSITLPASMKNINDYAFEYYYELEEINVDENNKYYKDVDGVLFTKDSGMLVYYPMAKQGAEYKVPAGTAGIYNDAFYDNDYITEVIIPNGTAYIGSYAFEDCSNLERITIPRSVVNMYTGTFDLVSDEFVIRGYENSYAEAMAYDWGFDFEVLAETLISAAASKTGSQVKVSLGESADGIIYAVQYDKDGYILAIDSQNTTADVLEYTIILAEAENEAETKVFILDRNNNVTPVAEVMKV